MFANQYLSTFDLATDWEQFHHQWLNFSLLNSTTLSFLASKLI
jgi:hypothetical protein